MKWPFLRPRYGNQAVYKQLVKQVQENLYIVDEPFVILKEENYKNENLKFISTRKTYHFSNI